MIHMSKNSKYLYLYTEMEHVYLSEVFHMIYGLWHRGDMAHREVITSWNSIVYSVV